MPSFEKNATRTSPFTRQIRPRRRKMPKDAENATSSVFRVARNVAFSRIVGIEREKPGANPSADLQLIGYAGGWIVDGDVQTLKVGVDPAWRRHGIARELLSRVASPGASAIAHRPDLTKMTVELDGGRLHALPYSPK